MEEARLWFYHVSHRAFDGELSYWRLASGIEVDFVLGEMQVAIEAKSSERITQDPLKGLTAGPSG